MSNVDKRKKKAKPLGRSRRKIVNLDPKRIKESQDVRWDKELYIFLSALSESELEIAKKLASILLRRPDMKSEPGEVIQFVKGVVK